MLRGLAEEEDAFIAPLADAFALESEDVFSESEDYADEDEDLAEFDSEDPASSEDFAANPPSNSYTGGCAQVVRRGHGRNVWQWSLDTFTEDRRGRQRSVTLFFRRLSDCCTREEQDCRRGVFDPMNCRRTVEQCTGVRLEEVEVA